MEYATRGTGSTAASARNALQEALKAKEPPPPVFDDSSKAGPNESSIESMYFNAPEQLLQVSTNPDIS